MRIKPPKKPRTIAPLRELPEYWEPMDARLREWIRDEIFLPLMRALKQPESKLENAKKSPLIAALGSGRIQYVDGHFEGDFNSAISKELTQLGAKFSKRDGWWSLPSAKLQTKERAAVRSAIEASLSRFEAMASRANKVLDELSPEAIAKKIKLESLFDSTMFKMDRAFQANVKKLGIEAALTPETLKHIAKRYTENTHLDIQGWVKDEIDALRNKVKERTLDYGERYETLIPGIRKTVLKRGKLIDDVQKRFAISERKAKFIARQENALIMSAFQEKRYTDVGLRRYEWHCVNMPPVPNAKTQPKGAVRPDHWHLNGSIQDWSRPPVVDSKTGRRGHPKQDYNCRCMALPVVE